MKKFFLAVTLATFAILVAMTGAKAAPVTTGNLAQSTIVQKTIEGLTEAHIVFDRPRHNCRRHGVCGGGFGIGPGGIYIGPGYYGYHGTFTRSCRRIRRNCRRRFDRRKRVRRCIRRNGC